MAEEKKFHLHDGKTGAAIAVRVTPRASRSEIAEIMSDGTVRIHLKVASEAQVNLVLIAYLSDILTIPVDRIEIVAGQTGKDKLITVVGVDAEKLHSLILQNLA